jgi:hypothetical protein
MKFLDKKRLIKILIDIDEIIELRWIVGAVCYMWLIFLLINQNATLDDYILVSVIYVIIYVATIGIASFSQDDAIISFIIFGFILCIFQFSFGLSQFNPIPFIFSLAKSIGVVIFSLGVAIGILYLKASSYISNGD